ncbi:Membrane-associated kinase regulator [Quillaja saponaria]|uniref:Membrane-associated kinase regulator n=1 Tax=Quillaja saponaria TaxID=32244 RepID=A0AAD7Q6G2_QUISA|nr:Membrane-associated kinase regulator [Quillaja saponaria]KAJ7975746.1 Membrane-associated kinase regulator [Quillaja saponaria]
MAIELCSESHGISMSPRISFSHDFSQSDAIPVEQHPLRSNSSGLNSGMDFDFCVRGSFDQDSTSADEIFSDGKILPIEIKKKNAPLKQLDQLAAHPPLPPPPAMRDNASSRKSLKNESTKESKLSNNEAEEKQSSKSFWGFKRSSSCGSGYGRSLCPLPLLSRSNSTGSSPKEGHGIKQNFQKHGFTKSSQSWGSSGYYQKPPLKKSHGSYGNNVRINPVLNVHSANLFGLGSIFSNGKDSNNSKKNKK